MKRTQRACLVTLVLAVFAAAACTVQPVLLVPDTVSDPLPSWNEGPARTAILDFVAAVTDPHSASYLPPEERIAVTDNDGMLWSESPVPVQAAFMFARIEAMAADHPEWASTQPYQAVIEHDQAALAALGEEEIGRLIAVTHAGMSEAEFMATVDEFLAAARHPRFGVPYTQTVYQPMLELLDFLRANGFRTFIVSGGGASFVRAFAQDVYGVVPEYVVGSSLEYEFQMTPQGAELVRLPDLLTINDGEQKAVNILRHIGRQPILAMGHSDGDLAMFQYTATTQGPYLNLVLVHDDPEREFDALTPTDELMTAAAQSPWMFVSMKRDFKTIFPAP